MCSPSFTGPMRRAFWHHPRSLSLARTRLRDGQLARTSGVAANFPLIERQRRLEHYVWDQTWVKNASGDPASDWTLRLRVATRATFHLVCTSPGSLAAVSSLGFKQQRCAGAPLLSAVIRAGHGGIVPLGYSIITVLCERRGLALRRGGTIT